MGGDTSPEVLCKYFDEACETSYFSDLFRIKGVEMNKMFDEKSEVVNLFNDAIWFQLTMPGQLLNAGDGVIQKDGAIVWKVDAFRLFIGCYTLSAESRIPNYWAFGITLLLIFASIWGIWRILYNRVK